MAVLVLATSGLRGEIGLARADGRLEVEALGSGAARGRGMLVAVDRLVEAAGLGPEDLKTVVVDRGPGSFTGVRVGVTTAKSLAFALGLDAIGVTSLRALAEAGPGDREILAIRDAGRGRLYAARFGPLHDGIRPSLGDPLRAPAAAVLDGAGAALVVGEQAARLVELAGLRLEALDLEADAAAVYAAAGPALRSGDVVSPHVLSPLYLQASAPERLRAGESADATSARVGDDRTT